MRGAKAFIGILITIIAMASLSACTATNGSKSAPLTSKPSSKPSPSDSIIQLAALPGANQPGTGAAFKQIADARGAGSHKIGIFRVQPHTKIFYQLSCEGPSPVTIASLYVVGPCQGGDLVSTLTTTTTTSRLVLTIQASSKVLWTIYVSQPIPVP
jgi:hypothetical protein